MSESLSSIPEGALPELRLAATNLLEAKRHLVRALTVGGACEWDDRPDGARTVGTLIQATRNLHTVCSELTANPQSAIGNRQ